MDPKAMQAIRDRDLLEAIQAIGHTNRVLTRKLEELQSEVGSLRSSVGYLKSSIDQLNTTMRSR